MRIDEHQRGRAELAGYFVRNAVPTEANFADLIASTINQRDDGVVKQPGAPLGLVAVQQSGGSRALDLYGDPNDPAPAWSLGTSVADRTGLAVVRGRDAQVPLFVDDETGNVGVGTTTPQHALQVHGPVAGAAVYFTETRHQHSGVGNAPGHAAIENDGGTYDTLMVLGRTRGDAAHPLRRHVTLWDDAVVAGTLTVQGPVTANAGPAGGFTFPPDAFGGAADRAWMRWTTRGGEATTLQLGTSNDADDHIALMPGMEHPDGGGLSRGNVGVGTLAPQWKLDVKGPVAGSAVYFTETAHQHAGVGNAPGRAAIENDAGKHNTLMVLGRTQPTGRRNVTLYDDVWVAGTFYGSSDARLKHDVEDCPHGLEAVLGLRPVAFRWNGDLDGPKTLGLIAQEVQGVVDEVVDDRGDRLAVSYTGLVPVLVRAVQELERRVAALQPVLVGGTGG